MRLAPLFLSSMTLVLSACNGPDRQLPAPYRNLEVPTSRLRSVAARGRGRALFLANCSLCHGENADGSGVRREGLSSAPRDFTDPTWRRRASPRRIFFTIREGSRGTPMPAWRVLRDQEIWDLTAYLLSAAQEP